MQDAVPISYDYPIEKLLGLETKLGNATKSQSDL